MKRKFGSLFGGCGGFSLGAKMADCDLRWAIEYEENIAKIANRNLGQHTICRDVLDCEPVNYEPVDILQASPPCPNFSIAKVGAKETELDIALANKIGDFIYVLQPKVFILENVYGYRNSESFKRICKWLELCDYSINFFHMNFADFGVAQTRKRLILIARKDNKRILRPSPTHQKIASMFHAPWVGWYEATKQFHDDCDESFFADWQIDLMMKMPEFETVLMHNQKSSDSRNPAQPIYTVTSKSFEAFLLRGDNSSSAKIVNANDPSFTVTSNQERNHHRAFLFEKANTSRLGYRSEDEPSMTLISRMDKTQYIAWLQENGKVIKLNIDCLAALQSFPPEWVWPSKISIAGKAIGNAIPPLAAMRIIEST